WRLRSFSAGPPFGGSLCLPASASWGFKRALSASSASLRVWPACTALVYSPFETHPAAPSGTRANTVIATTILRICGLHGLKDLAKLPVIHYYKGHPHRRKTTSIRVHGSSDPRGTRCC